MARRQWRFTAGTGAPQCGSSRGHWRSPRWLAAEAFLRILRPVLLAAPGLLAAAALFALPPERALSQFSSRGWTTVDGLPQNAITAVQGGPEGYLWIGTQEGLARFDGVRFTIFHRRNTEAFLDHFITDLEVAGDGGLWIGTRKGLLRYRRGVFERFSTAQGLPHEYVRSLYGARDGSLWIGTYGGGLARWHEGVFETFGEEAGLPPETVGRAILEDARGVLWVGTQEGLFRRRGDRFEAAGESGSPLAEPIRSLAASADGRLWVATERSPVLEVESGRVVGRLPSLGRASDPPSVLAVDRQGSLWIGTNGNGLVRYRDGRAERLEPGEGLAHEVVWSIFEDREGSLWVGTRGGLNQLIAGRVTAFTERQGLTNDFVRVVLEDEQGVIWVGTGGGLFQIRDGAVSLSPLSPRLATDHIRALALGGPGELWVGTRAGVHRIRGSVIEHRSQADGLPQDIVNAVLADGRGGAWVGTSGGLARWQGEEILPVPLEGLKEPIVRVLGIHGDSLWVGTEEGLLRLQDGAQRRFTMADGLPSEFIYALHFDGKGVLWVGTSGGLARLQDKRLESFTLDQGLFSNLVFQILEDGGGDLWLSCNRGIFRLPRRELEAVRRGAVPAVTSFWLDESDGMASSECNGGSQPAGWRSRDGRLWFPTIRGVAVVEPGGVGLYETPPAPLIEAVAVDGLQLRVDELMVLGPGQRLVEIRYTAPTFRSAHKVRFRYRLLGFSDQWTEAGSRREAFFTSLLPGTYRFQVEAARGGGVWGSTPAELELQVRPFLYQTRWFQLLVAVLALLLLWLLVRLRLRSLAARQAELVALVRQRTAQLESANRKLERLAAVDPLTGIANQRQFRKTLHQEWRRAARSRQPLAMLLIDVDFFKRYNDTYGHLAGDSCLVKVAQALASCLERAGDTVARYGGEEFAAILPRTGQQAALVLAERVRRAVEALAIEHRGSEVAAHVTVSIGVATAAPPDESPGWQPEGAMDSLIAQADQALYRAKGDGRNRVR